MTTMTVEFECGHTYEVPLVLRDDQLALAHASLIDQIDLMIEATHAAEHPECAS
jgi:hypothetical protein